MKKIAILIVSYNAIERLLQCLEALKTARIYEKNFKIEIFLVDNDSNQPVYDKVKKLFPEVHIKRTDTNLGFSKGQNVALKNMLEYEKRSNIKFDFVVTLNPDTILENDTLSRLVEYYIDRNSIDNKIGVLAPKIINEEGVIEKSIHLNPTAFIFFLKLFGIDLQYIKNKKKYISEDPTTVFSVSGAFFMTEREVIDKIGYFDEDYFFYYEDIDFCKRVNDAGYKVVFCPQIIIKHARGESVQSHENRNWSKEQTYISNAIYFKKHKGAFEKFLIKYGRIFEMVVRIIIGFEREWAKKMLSYFIKW